MEVFHCENSRIDYILHPTVSDEAPLVLLHGLGASHAQFGFLVDQFAASRTLLLIDLPGHGENKPNADDKISFDLFCSLILRLCAKLDLPRADFAGISMGSALALMCAAQYPDLVRHLFLIRPSWLASAAPVHLSLIARCGEWLTDHPLPKAIEALNADPEYRQIREDVPLAADSVHALFERSHAKLHAPVLSAMYFSTPFDAVSQLRNISTPATIIGCNADSLHPVSIANATKNALPDADLQLIPPRYLQPKAHQAELVRIIAEKTGALT